ncbi:MAG: energy-coupling factor transporter transmembrane component T family protein [Dehalococcoidia bacterium]|nr:Energy-coupling factor transporter transmembrane protein EcfT [Chloroflexota bacterium]
MSSSITFGHYFPGNSLLHRLDPRMKMCALFLLIVVLFITRSFWGLLLIGVFVFGSLVSTGISLKYFFRGLRPIAYIIFITVVLHFLFTPGGEVWLRIGRITIESDGVYLGIFMAARLMLLVMMSTLLILTTSPVALTDTIESFLRPFRRLGVPAHEIAMIMTIALRFIPTLMTESEKIVKARIARGADFTSGNIFERARSLIPIIVPLFVSAFRRADDLAVAMEARCYRGGENRTRMRELCLKRIDFIGFFVVVLLVSTIVALRIWQ